MKNILLLASIFILCRLPFPAAACSEDYYLIVLKNGRSLATPLYWQAGTQVFFFHAGGTVGVEKPAIERVEKHQGERNFFGPSAAGTKETTGSSPSPPPPKDKSPEPEKPAGAKTPAEKVSVADYKEKKDLLEVELESLLDRRREAGQRKDREAQEKLTEEIRKISTEVYEITDEVKAKNKGRLPEGWWNK